MTQYQADSSLNRKQRGRLFYVILLNILKPLNLCQVSNRVHDVRVRACIRHPVRAHRRCIARVGAHLYRTEHVRRVHLGPPLQLLIELRDPRTAKLQQQPLDYPVKAADLVMCPVDASRQVSHVCASLSGSTLAAFVAFVSHGSVRAKGFKCQAQSVLLPCFWWL